MFQLIEGVCVESFFFSIDSAVLQLGKFHMFVFILAIKRVRVNYDDKTYYDDNNNMKSDPINADCG